MMASRSKRREILALIEAALDGHATSDQASAFMGKLQRDDSEDVRLAAHTLIHFFDDEDIRGKDATDAQSQREELQRWVQVLAVTTQTDNS